MQRKEEYQVLLNPSVLQTLNTSLCQTPGAGLGEIVPALEGFTVLHGNLLFPFFHWLFMSIPCAKSSISALLLYSESLGPSANVHVLHRLKKCWKAWCTVSLNDQGIVYSWHVQLLSTLLVRCWELNFRSNMLTVQLTFEQSLSDQRSWHNTALWFTGV